jgi:hypothetical protein
MQSEAVLSRHKVSDLLNADKLGVTQKIVGLMVYPHCRRAKQVLGAIRTAGIRTIYRFYHGAHEEPRRSTKGVDGSRDQAPQAVL